MTRDEWLRSFPPAQQAQVVRRREIVLPCGADYGCDREDCRGWIALTDIEFDELHPWTEQEIAEARAYRDSL